VPAILVSPWAEEGAVHTDEYRHTSLIATLTEAWGLGAPFTQRDASARTFGHLLALDEPRDPQTWVDVEAQPVPPWTMDPDIVGRGISGLGKGVIPAVIAKARELGVTLPPELADPDADVPPRVVIEVFRDIAAHFFPLLRPER
jgi:phospholipase C